MTNTNGIYSSKRVAQGDKSRGIVIPAKAGIQSKTNSLFHWTPAFAGVTTYTDVGSGDLVGTLIGRAFSKCH
jgi:hypothetical protein